MNCTVSRLKTAWTRKALESGGLLPARSWLNGSENAVQTSVGNPSQLKLFLLPYVRREKERATMQSNMYYWGVFILGATEIHPLRFETSLCQVDKGAHLSGAFGLQDFPPKISTSALFLGSFLHQRDPRPIAFINVEQLFHRL
mmetsp:Transcript_16830/g.34773  ORF Transcript_16830/g.34773 Transcript_16830/m.34773 type:complete len:143 (+) Transcript_16830:1903-2331(+)